MLAQSAGPRIEWSAQVKQHSLDLLNGSRGQFGTEG